MWKNKQFVIWRVAIPLFSSEGHLDKINCGNNSQEWWNGWHWLGRKLSHKAQVDVIEKASPPFGQFGHKLWVKNSELSYPLPNTLGPINSPLIFLDNLYPFGHYNDQIERATITQPNDAYSITSQMVLSCRRRHHFLIPVLKERFTRARWFQKFL